MSQWVEGVPNFSEGRDTRVIGKIAQALDSVTGSALLHVDRGGGVNRTVMTVAGEPESLLEALFRGIEEAVQWIDMRTHAGIHPCQGACDVCPIVPVSGATLASCADLARDLSQRVGSDLDLPVYYYGAAASSPRRQRLAFLRRGGFLALPQKMADEAWRPDAGPSTPHPSAGAVVIGSRDYLIAYNVDLDVDLEYAATEDRSRGDRSVQHLLEAAQKIARRIRERGRDRAEPGLPGCLADAWVLADGNPEQCGEIVPGGRVQVTMNLTRYRETGLHDAYDRIYSLARDSGLRIVGSELIGLVPQGAVETTGRHALAQATRHDDPAIGKASLGDLAHAAQLYLGLRSSDPRSSADFRLLDRVLEHRIATHCPAYAPEGLLAHASLSSS